LLLHTLSICKFTLSPSASAIRRIYSRHISHSTCAAGWVTHPMCHVR
jgi:hypothetical protein